MSITNRNSAIEKLYTKYEYMANSYANKVFNFEIYGYEKEDIIQELRIKIYTSIITYSEKWSEYKATGRYKPVPIEFYLKSAMVNKVKDFIKLFNQEAVENVKKISVESDGFDHSEYNTIETEFNLNRCVCQINGVDLFEGLRGRKKQVFSLFLKGFTVPELNKRFNNIDVTVLVNSQIERLKTKKTQLLDYKHMTYSTIQLEEE